MEANSKRDGPMRSEKPPTKELIASPDCHDAVHQGLRGLARHAVCALLVFGGGTLWAANKDHPALSMASDTLRAYAGGE